MISVDDAKAIIESNIKILGVEKVQLKNIENRILAEDIIAKIPSPLFNNSAMDGFALRSSDILGATNSNPVKLKLVSISSAGSPTGVFLKRGECIQCMTGAKIPEGADTIVMVENTSGFNENKFIKIFSEVLLGKHIRKKGEEIKKGSCLISKGTRITPSEVGVLATFGYASASVYRQPKVGIFGTGNELVEPGSELKSGQIYNSNLYVFSDLVKKTGAQIITQNVIKDDKSTLKKFLKNALKTCDVIISSGGVSMGRYDYVREVFMELGVHEGFWKVAQKPGKPLFFGYKNSKIIFGLPGNPVSSYIGFMIWVWPALEKMMGENKSSSVSAILKEEFPLEKQKYRFLFGKAWIEDGILLCKPSTKLGSHMLSSSIDANCIISSKQGSDHLQPGDKVNIKLLPWKNLK